MYKDLVGRSDPRLEDCCRGPYFFCFMPKNPRLRFKSMNVWRATYSQRKVNEFDSHRSHVQNAHVLI
jgi:hypothetical protein